MFGVNKYFIQKAEKYFPFLLKNIPVDAIDMISIAEHGRPPQNLPCIVTRGNRNTTFVAYWHDGRGKVEWVLTGYAGHIIAEQFHPTHYYPLPKLHL